MAYCRCYLHMILTGKYDRLRVSGFGLLSDRVQDHLVQLQIQSGASHAGQGHWVADVFVRVHTQQDRTYVGLKQ